MCRSEYSGFPQKCLDSIVILLTVPYCSMCPANSWTFTGGRHYADRVLIAHLIWRRHSRGGACDKFSSLGGFRGFISFRGYRLDNLSLEVSTVSIIHQRKGENRVKQWIVFLCQPLTVTVSQKPVWCVLGLLT